MAISPSIYLINVPLSPSMDFSLESSIWNSKKWEDFSFVNPSFLYPFDVWDSISGDLVVTYTPFGCPFIGLDALNLYGFER